jgi:hypothetical protein
MKTFKFFSLAVVSLLALFGCENAELPTNPFSGSDGAVFEKGKPAASEMAPLPVSGDFAGYNETDNPDYGVYTYTLWAGKHNDAGTVTITNDDENILITVNTNSSADLGEIHVYLWNELSSIPSKRPAPGHADFVVENINADSYTLIIPADIDCGNTYYISVHAALIQNNTSNDEPGIGNNDGETAYAGNDESPADFNNQKGAWWGLVNYHVDCFFNISGNVYNDLNNNYMLNPGENGINTLEVILLDSDGNVVDISSSDADGNYLFEYVPGGIGYHVVVSEGPAGSVATENADGYSIALLDSDVTDVNFGFHTPNNDDNNDNNNDNVNRDIINHETAFAYGNVSFCSDGFSRWGWRNELNTEVPGTLTFPVYAGAAQCDTTKGTYVGNVTIEIHETVVITLSMLPGYGFDELHINYGSNPYPLGNNGNPTVAPGSYTIVEEYTSLQSNWVSSPISVNDFGGINANVIIHTVVSSL